MTDRAEEAGASNNVGVFEKEHKMTHESTIAFDAPAKMLADYFNNNPEYTGRSDRLIKHFKNVCI